MRIMLDSNPTKTDKNAIEKIIGYAPTPDMPIIIERKTTKDVTIKNTYDVTTTKGILRIEAYNNEYYQFFKNNIEKFEGLNIQWTDKNTVNFGTFPVNFDVTRKQFDYESYDVLFGLSGFDKSQGVIIFVKKGYIRNNGLEKGVFGKVVKGKHLLFEMESSDKIIKIEKRQVRSEVFDYKIVTSGNELVQENDHIITKVVVDLDEKCPYACEHFLFLTANGTFEITESLNTYCKNASLKGVTLLNEQTKLRSKGSLSVRISGKEKGCVYAYFNDSIEDKTHSVFGNIIKGLELLQQLKPKQKAKISSSIMRINTLGLTQLQAEKLAKKSEIEHIRAGDASDDAIIIRQDPELTLDAKKKNSIVTEGVNPKNVFKVQLYNDVAPNTVRYFKTITGLKTRALGRLSVIFAHEEMDMILFTGDSKLGGDLIPENHPASIVKAGDIGVTNMASRQKGTVGVRFNDNKEYGPTGEDFSHTNIVAHIENIGALCSIKDNDTIYLLLDD